MGLCVIGYYLLVGYFAEVSVCIVLVYTLHYTAIVSIKWFNKCLVAEGTQAMQLIVFVEQIGIRYLSHSSAVKLSRSSSAYDEYKILKLWQTNICKSVYIFLSLRCFYHKAIFNLSCYGPVACVNNLKKNKTSINVSFCIIILYLSEKKVLWSWSCKFSVTGYFIYWHRNRTWSDFEK